MLPSMCVWLGWIYHVYCGGTRRLWGSELTLPSDVRSLLENNPVCTIRSLRRQASLLSNMVYTHPSFPRCHCGYTTWPYLKLVQFISSTRNQYSCWDIDFSNWNQPDIGSVIGKSSHVWLWVWRDAICVCAQEYIDVGKDSFLSSHWTYSVFCNVQPIA